MHSYSILREALNRLKELEPRILSPSHTPTGETPFPSKETSFPSVEPSTLETSSVHPETSSKKDNLSNLKTPRKVPFKEDPLPRLVTPSSPQPSIVHQKKKKTQLAIVA